MGVVYLTVDQVIEFHAMALAATGGSGGLRSAHSLASAVYQPQQTFGEDLYATIPEKAAAYGFFIAEAQAFTDGNKRTAAVAMLVFPSLNGYDFQQTDDEMEEMFVAIGDHSVVQGEFFGWVCNHARHRSA